VDGAGLLAGVEAHFFLRKTPKMNPTVSAMR
jgi:hypothetical protein